MKMLKTSITLLILTLSLFTFLQYAYATDITTREDIKLDDTLAEEQVLFTQPQKVYVAQISSANKDFKNDSEAWIRAIYYYSITRLKLNDIPFNYLIDSSGNVYEGTKGGPGANPGLEGGENVVLIGLLDSDSTLTPRIQTSLTDLVDTLSYKYGIKEGAWSFVDLTIVEKDNERSYLQATQSNTSASQMVAQAISGVRWSAQEHLDYKASITAVDYAKEVEIGQELPVTVTIKNENDFTWFCDSSFIYLATSDGKDSPYAINSVWESFSRPTHIAEKFVKPGESVEVKFSLLGKSKPAEYKGSFVFTKDTGTVFEGSGFDVDFNIIAGDNKLVQVVSPEYGFVNIRECRWYSCKKVEVANDGDVFIMSKEEEGWYEIYYKGESKGWVYQKYIKEL